MKIAKLLKMSSYQPVCPFCRLTEFTDYATHLTKAMCQPYECEACCLSTSFQCDKHKDLRQGGLPQDEIRSLKIWNEWYLKNMEWSPDFVVWRGCDFCKKLTVANPNPIEIPEVSEPIIGEVENHIRTHLQYFTELQQKVNCKASPEAPVIRPIRKLDIAFNMMRNHIRAFFKTVDEGGEAPMSWPVNGDGISNGHPIAITLDSSDEEFESSVISNGHTKEIDQDRIKPEISEEERPTSPKTMEIEHVVDEHVKSIVNPKYSEAIMEAIERGKRLGVSIERIPEIQLKDARIIRDPNVVLSREEIKKRKKAEKRKTAMKSNIVDEVEKKIRLLVPQVLGDKVNDDQVSELVYSLKI